jgi:hypothetical protein
MKIEISDKHADVICKACDVLSRLYMGQMEIVLLEMFWKTEPEAREAVSAAFKAIVPTTHGIFGDVPQDAKVAWDIQQVIRQDLAIRRNGGKRNPMQVHFDDPMQSSKEPLPKIIGQVDQELLEALERLVMERKEGIASLAAWDQARAVIAKAKGGAE